MNVIVVFVVVNTTWFHVNYLLVMIPAQNYILPKIPANIYLFFDLWTVILFLFDLYVSDNNISRMRHLFVGLQFIA